MLVDEYLNYFKNPNKAKPERNTKENVLLRVREKMSKILRKIYYEPREKIDFLQEFNNLEKELEKHKEAQVKRIKAKMKFNKESKIFRKYYNIQVKIKKYIERNEKFQLKKYFQKPYSFFETHYIGEYLYYLFKTVRLRVITPYWSMSHEKTLYDNASKYEQESVKFQLNFLSFFYKHSRNENLIKFSEKQNNFEKKKTEYINFI